MLYIGSQCISLSITGFLMDYTTVMWSPWLYLLDPEVEVLIPFLCVLFRFIIFSLLLVYITICNSFIFICFFVRLFLLTIMLILCRRFLWLFYPFVNFLTSFPFFLYNIYFYNPYTSSCTGVFVMSNFIYWRNKTDLLRLQVIKVRTGHHTILTFQFEVKILHFFLCRSLCQLHKRLKV